MNSSMDSYGVKEGKLQSELRDDRDALRSEHVDHIRSTKEALTNLKLPIHEARHGRWVSYRMTIMKTTNIRKEDEGKGGTRQETISVSFILQINAKLLL